MRPAFKSQFVVASGDVFVVASETETRFLHGRVAARVIPLLTGQRTVEEIVEIAGPEIPRPEVVEYIQSLEASGLLADGAAAPRSEAAFWEYAGAHPGQVAERRHAAAADVVSVGEAAVTGIGEALQSLGIPVRPGAAFRLVAAADYCDSALDEINREALHLGTAWMLVRPYGRVQWLGPIFVPGETACWRCLAHSLERNGWRAETAVANLPITAAVTRTLSALEAAKWLLTGHNPSLEGSIQALDTVTLGFTAHHVNRRPQCPACSGKASGSRLNIETLISRFTGIVEDLSDTVVDAGLCVTEARGSRVLWPDADGTLYYCRPDAALGKGTTPAEARQACLGEAIERYSCHFHGDEPRIQATLREMGEQAVDPCCLLLYSEAQYGGRERWNEEHGEFHRVGEPFDRDATVDWTRVHVWPAGAERYVPTGFCYLGYENPFCGADTNGCAAGASLDDALLRGLFELVERDAVALWWYNRARRPKLDLAAMRSPRIGAIVDMICRKSRTVEVLDLTTDFGIPVCVAISARADGSRIMLGSAASGDFETAAWRALAEAGCLLATGSQEAGRALTKDELAVKRWFEEVTFENQPWLSNPAPSRADAFPAPADASECVRRLEQRGLQVMMLDCTRPEIGLPVVRVIVPGLRPWWARFAPGRLYDTPVELGWQPRRLSEAELNPIPFFL